MRTDEIERVRGALDEFAAAVLAPLLKDQRGKGGLYLQGLMPEGRRKSMQSTAARLSVDHRQLQQFVSSSPWLVEPGHRILAQSVGGRIRTPLLQARPNYTGGFTAERQVASQPECALPHNLKVLVNPYLFPESII